MNEAFIFLLYSPLGIQHAYSIKFSIGQSNSEIPLLIQSEIVLSYFF